MNLYISTYKNRIKEGWWECESGLEKHCTRFFYSGGGGGGRNLKSVSNPGCESGPMLANSDSYCVSKKSRPHLNSKYAGEIGQHFLGIK